ncbi:MAG: ABC transporter substrate-binding protein, partial [Deltaproteobacteria bacterium]|nr:ABC transporter substrate-binding protein [Deltaproteobacteria bacterium]
RRAAVTDALGRAVALAPTPSRVVSLVPSVTECLFDAGLGARVAGRTDFCVSPPEAAGVPTVGGPKTVDVEALLRLGPDLVLANAEENDRAQVEALAASGVRVHVAFPKTLPQTAALLRDLGALLHAEAPFEGFARGLERAAQRPPGLRPVRCACLVWKDPLMTASGDTLTSALVEAGGGENVFATAGEFRYPAVSPGALAAAAPRVILLPSDPYDFTADDARELEALVPGATALRIPGAWVTWYGSRMEAAVRGLRRALDPFR